MIGSALTAAFKAAGDEIIPLSRNFSSQINFEGIDAVIHLAGEPISVRRWSDSKRDKIRTTRVGGTQQLAELIATAKSPPSIFISSSAIGYYGEQRNLLRNEDSPPGEGFLSTVCTEWEKATAAAENAGIRTIHLRTGLVLSLKGGALKSMIFPFKIGIGGKLGTGEQMMSWISLDDVVGSIRFLIEKPKISGAVNLVSPNPVTNNEFAKTLGRVLHRPCIFSLPAFMLRILFGEMADELLLSSTRVIPATLMEAGYTFKHTDLKSALEDILQ